MLATLPDFTAYDMYLGKLITSLPHKWVSVRQIMFAPVLLMHSSWYMLLPQNSPMFQLANFIPMSADILMSADLCAGLPPYPSPRHDSDYSMPWAPP